MPHREPSPSDPEPQLQELESFIRPLITSFADELGYKALSNPKDDALWQAMCQYADRTGVAYDEGSHSWQLFKAGYMYPVVCLPHHPLQVKVYVGIYSWLGLLLDDEAANFTNEFQAFHRRFCAGEPQPLPLLQGWADLMKLTYKYWDPVAANFIVSSSLNFLNANVLEVRNEFGRMERTKSGDSWAWFLREKDGVGEAYAWFTFPMAISPDMSCYLEVIPDLSSWIGRTNDVLSFYKEEKAGDLHNYIHNRSWYEKKTSRAVFADLVDEVRVLSAKMRLVLKGRDSYLQLLNSHLIGYIGFHKLNSRYKLWEVGLGEKNTDRTVLRVQ